MSTLTWVLAGFLAFWLGAAALRARGVLPASVRVYGPLVSLHTKRGRAFLERVAAPKRFWRAWGNVGLGVALVVMVGALVALLLAVVLRVQNPPPAGNPLQQPRNALVIPGVNDFFPPAAAPEILFGLAVALVVHEAGHGILCRVEDIDIESMGLVFLTLVPAGAFVQPDEESAEAADRGARSRMFAAGVTNNFALTIVALLLLFGPVAGSLGVVSGATVGGALPGSPAAQAGIGQGDVIVGIENRSVASNEDLDEVLRDLRAERVRVERREGGDLTVEREVLVTANVDDGPIDLDTNTTVVAVNGTSVATTADLYGVLEGTPVATFHTAAGETVTAPAGAYVSVAPDGPLSVAGAPNSTAVVTSVGGERTVTMDDFADGLEAHDPGDAVNVTLYVDGEPATYNVTLGEGSDGPEDAHLGVYLLGPGVSGMTVSDFGAETYPAGRYLGLLGGDCPDCDAFGGLSLGLRLYFVFTLPFIGVAGIPALPYNFAGFVGPVADFFVVSGPLGFLGSGVAFLVANLLFWTAWINVNLAFFNCIPTFLLDGGHILRASVEGAVSRLPVVDKRRVVTAATVTVQLVMLGSLLLLLFGGQLLA